MVQSEVQALLGAAVEGEVDGDEAFSVVHILGQDGKEKSFLVLLYLMLGQFWASKVEHFLGGKGTGFLLPLVDGSSGRVRLNRKESTVDF